MKHVQLVLLAPVFPAVELHAVHVHVTVPVGGSSLGGAYTVSVESRIKGARVLKVEGVNLGVEPVYLLLLIDIVSWLRPIVIEPG